MKFRNNKLTTAISLLVTLAVGQLYLGVAFAETKTRTQLMGVLTTSSGKAITVNGASAVSGATIASGSTIETPDGVGATIRLGELGSICLAEKTKLTLEFDQSGKLVKVNLTEGCIILQTPKDVAGTINGAQGIIGQIAATNGGSMDVCLRPGAAPSINQGHALNAGAGASALDCGAAGAAAIPTGLNPAVAALFIGGGAAGLFFLFRGTNPSPSGT